MYSGTVASYRYGRTIRGHYPYVAPHCSIWTARARWSLSLVPIAVCRARNKRRSHVADDDHDELPGAVDALDAVELDVGSGRRGGDQRDRRAQARGIAQRGDRFGNDLHDLVGLDHTDVQVYNEADRATAFVIPGRER